MCVCEGCKHQAIAFNVIRPRSCTVTESPFPSNYQSSSATVTHGEIEEG